MSVTKRFAAPAPKVGIRPTIDGRLGGVRESLEEQTMNMAKSAAKLISENLRHPDGSAVDCVIADSTIGGVAEAQACAEKFARAGVGVSLTVTPCWCYGSETMDMDKSTPKAIWGFNGTEAPRCGISRRGTCRTQPKRHTRIFNIWARCAGCGRY